MLVNLPEYVYLDSYRLVGHLTGVLATLQIHLQLTLKEAFSD